jgi:hypothetical protein
MNDVTYLVDFLHELGCLRVKKKPTFPCVKMFVVPLYRAHVKELVDVRFL